MDYGNYSVINGESLIAVQAQTDVPIVPIWMSERQGDGYHTLAEGGLTPMRSLRNMRKALRRWIDYGSCLSLSTSLPTAPVVIARAD